MTVESTIGSSGKDYADPASWEASIPANPTEDYVGTCELDESYEGLLLFRGSNTNSVNIILQVAAGVRHDFQRGTGARQIKTTGDSNAAVHIDMENVTIRDFGMYATGGTGTRYPLNLNANTQTVTVTTLENCFIDHEGAAAVAINYGSADASYVVNIERCCINTHDQNAAQVCQLVEKNAGATINFQNCSFNIDGLTTGQVFNSSMGSGTDTLNINDCKILVNGSGAIFNTGAGGVYNGANNVISEGSAPSPLGVLAGGFGVNQSASDHYTSSDGSSPDLSIKSTLNKANYIGSDNVAGDSDVEGNTYVAGFCDTGANAQSTAPAGNGASRGIGMKLRLGLRL